MHHRLVSLTRLGFVAALGLFGACNPSGLGPTDPSNNAQPGDEPGHIPYDAKKVAVTTAQAVSAAQKGINWVMPDAYSWITGNGCAACHRGGSVLTGQAIAKHNGLTINNSAGNGVPWLAQLVKNEQQGDGGWTHSGSYRKSKTAWSLSGLAQYTQWSGSSVFASALKPAVNYMNGVTNNYTFANDGNTYAGQTRRYLEEDLGNCPVDCAWPSNSALTVQGIAVLLQQPGLSAAEISTYTTFMNSITDMLEGHAVRNIANNGWGAQYLSYALVAMVAAGRTPANNANALAIRNRLLVLGGAANTGWGDVNFGYGSNALSTGQALYALCTAGTSLAQNAVIQNGIDFLFNNQAASGAWTYGALTADVPTTFATLGLACYGALNVTVTTSNISPVDPANATQSKIAPASPSSQTVTFKINVQNTGLVTNTFTFSASAGLNGVVSVSPSSLTVGANASGSATVTTVYPPGLPVVSQAPVSVVTSYTGANGLVTESRSVNVATGAAPDPNASGTTTTFTAGAGGTVTAGNAITFSAQAKNGATVLSNGASLGAVTFYYGNTALATVTTTNGTFTYNWTVPTALQGNQTITASFSGVGPPSAIQYAASSVQTTITVNALPAPPAPTVTGPPSGTTSTNGNVSVTGASQAGAILTIKDASGANLGSITVPAGGAYNVPLNLAPGAYTITVIATNAAGNSPPSSSITLTVIPPALVVLGPANNTTTANGTVAISGTGYPGGTVTVKDGAVVVGTFTVAANGTWSGNVALAQGAHPLSITQTVSGATSTTPVTVNVGIVPPAPVITSPAANAGLPNGNNVITGTGVAGTTITVLDNGNPVGSGVVAANGTYNITVALFYGSHTLTTTATNPGGTSAPSAGVTVNVAPNAPIITSPVAATTDLVGPFTFAGSGVVGASLKIYDNGVLVTTLVIPANGSWSYAFAAASLGSHNLTATQTAGGLTSPASTAKTVVIHNDSDGDTIYDEVDNCIMLWNKDQVDRDADGVGDVCDKAPGQTDASNNTTSATDISLTTDPSADTNLLAANQNNLITLLAGAWAGRNTLTLVNVPANNSGNIEIWGKASPSVAAWTKMTSYDAQLGPSHPATLAGGLAADVAVTTPRTSLANYANRYKQFQVRVKEADGSVTIIPHCASGATASATDDRCVNSAIAYTLVDGTNVDAGIKLIFKMKAF